MRKRALFARWAAHHARARLERQFLDVRVLGQEYLTRQLQTGPLILAANHVCWWDPLVLLRLGQAFEMDGYCLMDRKNLDALPFFGAVGAVPISSDVPRDALRELRAAAGVLDRPGRALAIFPHGAQRPAHLPLEFKAGVVALSRLSHAPIVPLALRYDFHEGPRALVHLSFGPPLIVSAGATSPVIKQLESRVRRALDEVDTQLARGALAPSLLHARPIALEKERIPWLARLTSSFFRGHQQ